MRQGSPYTAGHDGFKSVGFRAEFAMPVGDLRCNFVFTDTLLDDAEKLFKHLVRYLDRLFDGFDFIGIFDGSNFLNQERCPNKLVAGKLFLKYCKTLHAKILRLVTNT